MKVSWIAVAGFVGGLVVAILAAAFFLREGGGLSASTRESLKLETNAATAGVEVQLTATPIRPIAYDVDRQAHDMQEASSDHVRRGGDPESGGIRVVKGDDAILQSVSARGVDPAELQAAMSDPERRELALVLARDFLTTGTELLERQNRLRSAAAQAHFAKEKERLQPVEESRSDRLRSQMAEPWKVYSGNELYVFDLHLIEDVEYHRNRLRISQDLEANRSTFRSFIRDL